jgi:hypothetical protein
MACRCYVPNFHYVCRVASNRFRYQEFDATQAGSDGASRSKHSSNLEGRMFNTLEAVVSAAWSSFKHLHVPHPRLWG